MLKEGTKVRVKKATQHNGKFGIVTKAAGTDGRVAVQLVGGKTLAVRAENLEALGVMSESSEATTSSDAHRNAWREVLPVVDHSLSLSGGQHQSLASLCLEKVASSVGNMEEFNGIVKSDESGTMDRLLKQRRIAPEVIVGSKNTPHFIPYAAHVELNSDWRHVATILFGLDEGTIQCTFNADATKCCYTEYSPLNCDKLDAMVEQESEKYPNGHELANMNSTSSLWMRTGGAVRVVNGFLAVLHQTNPPMIKPLMSDDYLPNYYRIVLPRVITDDSTYAIIEPCQIEPDGDDPSTWGSAGTQGPPMLVRLDILTGECHEYEFKRSEECEGGMVTALDYKDFLHRYHGYRFPAKYNIDFMEIINSSGGDACIIMSIYAGSMNAAHLLYHGRLVDEETEYGGTMSRVVWTCVCRPSSLSLNPSSAACRATGAIALTADACKGINGNSTRYDPEKHNYTDYGLVRSAFEKFAPGWSSPCQRLPILLQSWVGGGAPLAFSSDGKMLFAFGYDMGILWAEMRAQERKFIEAEVQKRLGEKQGGEDRISIEDEAYNLWIEKDDDTKRMKLKAYCRDI